MKKADYLMGLSLILFSIYVMAESWRMPRLEHLQAHPLSAPGIVPAFLAAVLLVFGLILVTRSIRAGGHRLVLSREGLGRVLSQPGNRRLLITALLTFIYAGVLVGRTPYTLVTGLFIFLFVMVFEWREGMTPGEKGRLGIAAATLAVVFSLAVSYTFEKLFLVTLP